ncbi:MAG TPA: hypothetical protein PLR25_02425 [Planctomycetaceae bacterium]|nr:hypothetical protein [Planctomycetaceae bacterium]
MSQVAEMQELLSPRVVPAVGTSADQETPALSSSPSIWQRIIDHTLIKWGEDPSVFADEDFEGPAPEIICNAIQTAIKCAKRKFPAPSNVVPDGDGGIVFELRNGNLTEKIHFWDNGEVEYFQLRGTRVVERCPLWLP